MKHPRLRCVRPSTILLPLMLCVSALSVRTASAQITVSGNQTFNVNTGNNYTSVQAYDTSHVNVLGGNVSELDSFDNSMVSVTGGTVGALLVEKDSTARVSGGTLQTLLAVDRGITTVTGGAISLLGYEDSSSGTISGGTITRLYSGNGNASITGGNLSSIQTLIQGNLTLSGFDFAVTAMSAGNITNPTFIYSGTFYTVTGRLQDNASVGTYTLFDSAVQTNRSTGAMVITSGKLLLNDFSTGRTTILSSSAPEPASLALLGMGALPLVGMVARRRRK